MAEGFLGRWAQRKSAARQGLPSDEATAPAAAADRPAGPLEPAAPGLPAQGGVAPAAAAVAPAPPSLQDAQALTTDCDFKPFLAQGVPPEVKNAALKRLFADPHYNVMDRLDTYIDDYSLADPIPESMLRNMASAQFLKLFEQDAQQAPPAEAPDAPAPAAEFRGAASAAPASAPTPMTPTGEPHHDHPDLRLQPDHAPGARGARGGAE